MFTNRIVQVLSPVYAMRIILLGQIKDLIIAIAMRKVASMNLSGPMIVINGAAIPYAWKD